MGGVSQAYLTNLLDRMRAMPIEDIMREDESALGNRPVRPGEAAWLSVADWPDHIVISVTPHAEVRIIAIVARFPGRGAFRRLIDRIVDAGLTPVILAPSREMRATMRRWGWRRSMHGRGFSAEEQWRPRLPKDPAP